MDLSLGEENVCESRLSKLSVTFCVGVPNCKSESKIMPNKTKRENSSYTEKGREGHGGRVRKRKKKKL